MDLMHLPQLEKFRADEKSMHKRAKSAKASSDSAYASSEDGSSSPGSLHRATRSQSSGLPSSSSRTSLITEIDDDLPPSRSVTPDSTYRSHSALSRSSSGIESEFTGTLHESGGINVYVTMTSEPDGDSVSCTEDSPAEVIDKLFQTVALPMLWNLSAVATCVDVTGFEDNPSVTAKVQSATDKIHQDEMIEMETLSNASLDVQPVAALDQRAMRTVPTVDAVDGDHRSRGCLDSSRKQLGIFFTGCRNLFQLNKVQNTSL